MGENLATAVSAQLSSITIAIRFIILLLPAASPKARFANAHADPSKSGTNQVETQPEPIPFTAPNAVQTCVTKDGQRCAKRRQLNWITGRRRSASDPVRLSNRETNAHVLSTQPIAATTKKVSIHPRAAGRAPRAVVPSTG